MKQTSNILKVAMAAALLFTVNMNADAQFGKLKGLADKAKSATKKASQNAEQSVTKNASQDYVRKSLMETILVKFFFR